MPILIEQRPDNFPFCFRCPSVLNEIKKADKGGVKKITIDCDPSQVGRIALMRTKKTTTLLEGTKNIIYSGVFKVPCIKR